MLVLQRVFPESLEVLLRASLEHSREDVDNLVTQDLISVGRKHMVILDVISMLVVHPIRRRETQEISCSEESLKELDKRALEMDFALDLICVGLKTLVQDLTSISETEGIVQKS